MGFGFKKKCLQELPVSKWFFPIRSINRYSDFLTGNQICDNKCDPECNKGRRYHRLQLRGRSITGQNEPTNIFFLHKNEDVVGYLRKMPLPDTEGNQKTGDKVSYFERVELSNYDRALDRGGLGARFFISADEVRLDQQWAVLEAALKLPPVLDRRTPDMQSNGTLETYDLIAEKAELAVNEAILEIIKTRENKISIRGLLKGVPAPDKVNLITEYGHSVTHIFVRDFLGIQIPAGSLHHQGKKFTAWIKVMFGNLFVNPGGRIFPLTWLSKYFTKKYIKAIEKSYEDPVEGSLLYRLKTIERTKLAELEITQAEYRDIVTSILMEVGGSFQYLTGEAFSGILKSIDEEHASGEPGSQSITNEDLLNIVGKVKRSPRKLINEYLRSNSPTGFIFRTVKEGESFSVIGDEADQNSIAKTGDLLCLLTAAAGRDDETAKGEPKKQCPHYVHFGGGDNHADPEPFRTHSHHPCFGQYWAQSILEAMLDGLLRLPNLRVQKTGEHKPSRYMALFDPEPNTQNFVTIVSEIPAGFSATAQKLIENWGNPIGGHFSLNTDGLETIHDNFDVSFQSKLKRCESLHFMSANVVEGQEHAKGFVRKISEFFKLTDKSKPLRYEPDYLLLEMSVDGKTEDAIDEICDELGTDLYELYRKAGILKTRFKIKTKKINAIKTRLHKDSYTLVQSVWPTLFKSRATTGLPFTGTAGLSCKRILAEQSLAKKIDDIIDDINQPNLEESVVGQKAGYNRQEKFNYQTPLARLHVIRKALFNDKVRRHNTDDSVNRLKWTLGGSRSPGFAEAFDDPWIKRVSDEETGLKDKLQLVGKLFPQTLFIPILFVFTFLASFLELRHISKPECDEALSCAEHAETMMYHAGAGTIASYLFIAIIFGNLAGLILRSFKSNLLGRAGEMFLVSGLFLIFILFFDHTQFLRRADLASNIHPIFGNDNHRGLLDILAIGGVLSIIMVFLEGLKTRKRSGYFFAKPLAFFLVWALISVIGFQHIWMFMEELKDPGVNFVSNRFPDTRLMDLIFYPLQYAMVITFSIHAYAASFLGSQKELLSKRNILIFTVFALAIGYAAFIPLSSWKSAHITTRYILSNIIIVPLILSLLLFLIYQWFTPSNSARKKGGYISVIAIGAIFSAIINLNDGLRGLVINLTGQDFTSYKIPINQDLIVPTFVRYLNSIFVAVPVTLLVLGSITGIIRTSLNLSESKNTPHDSDTTLSNEEAMLGNENAEGFEQNHMISVQRLLPEWMRLQFFLPLSYHVIKKMLTSGIIRPGFLGNVGTVHFARWVKFPRSRNYAFVSNYDGSFESYLEDFVTKVNSGLNAAWSHCVGFPKVKDIFFDGSDDGDRFIRWARGSTRPTPFWYTAYPDLTVEIIRRNALIRDGLVRARSASEAEAWFDLFNSSTRPEHALQTDQIQSFVFGASKNLTDGCCLLIKEKSHHSSDYFLDFVESLIEKITFGQARPENEAIYFAISKSGLDVLSANKVDRFKTHNWQGDQAVEDNVDPTWFPGAFASGMSHPTRKRVLGDDETSYDWGEAADKILGTILIYSDPGTGKSIADMVDELSSEAQAFEFQRIDFEPLKGAGPHKEPFGFVDGVSNPILRGTKQAARNPDSIHVVNPGEFILGYRDNRNHFPPSPQVHAKEDINRLLPAVPNEQPQKYPAFNGSSNDSLRDLGRNGSYLVIRQLEQSVDYFNDKALSEARKLAVDLDADKQTSEAEIDALIQNLSDKGYNKTVSSEEVEFMENLEAKISELWDKQGKSNISDPSYRRLLKLEIDKVKMQQLAEVVKAKMMGRWQNGQSLTTRPVYLNEMTFSSWLDWDSKSKSSIKVSEEFQARDNEYLFGRDDPQGYACPFGSHVRRTNPRESLDPGSERELEVSNRHRILRRGRSYQYDKNGETKRGTFFMCLNVDIERQFEFVQQSWMNGRNFHGLRNEYDPMTSRTTGSFTIQCPGANKKLNLSKFITMKGGGYFFMPSKDAMRYLATSSSN